MAFDHAAFINDPKNWPNWPALSVKRVVDGKMETAYLWGDPPPYDINIYAGNIWSMSEKDPILATYPSVEALVADGWQVD